MTNPFAQMTSVLAAIEPAESLESGRRINAKKRRINTPNGKTNLLRSAVGPIGRTAGDLAALAGISNTGLVWSLLKGDMAKGIIEFRYGLYRRADA